MKYKDIVGCILLAAPLVTVGETTYARDPFVRPALEPALAKELNDYPLDSLKIIGVMRQGPQAVAVVLDPKSQLYFLKIGDQLGLEKAHIMHIGADEITVTWLTQGQQFTEHLGMINEAAS